MKIRSRRIYTENGLLDGYLDIEQGKIKDLGPAARLTGACIDYGDARIIPGIFDSHNHGTMGYAVMGTVGPDKAGEVRGYLKGLASQGVTSVLATADPDMFPTLASMAGQPQDGARIAGIHSEGPYLNRVGEKGVDTGHPDIVLADCEKMVAEAGGWLRLFAIAPELPGAQQAVRYMLSQGVRVAFAHSNCDYQQAMEAFGWGITVTTHTCNVMSGIHHRQMGGLGACLLDDGVNNELICDFMHVSPEMIRLIFKCKPYSKIVMVSDNVHFAGAPAGRYHTDMMGAPMDIIIDQRGFCLSDTGRLCGSTKPVLYGIGNLVEKLGIPMADVLAMSSLNPARLYGLGDRTGSLWYGKDADLVVISDDYEALYTYSQGRLVYDHQRDTDLFNKALLGRCRQG